MFLWAGVLTMVNVRFLPLGEECSGGLAPKLEVACVRRSLLETRKRRIGVRKGRT